MYKILKTVVFKQCVSTATVTSVTGGILGSVVNYEKNCRGEVPPIQVHQRLLADIYLRMTNL